ncbi:MAG: Sec-independent protein translocase TatB [Sulfurovum sp.]|nr:MAG: Sec-independent protein translocase TatB [Sulfurovum sp.]
MFGIGFTELLLIAIVAILFLGPDKLPKALTDMAKFIRSIKKTIGEAKASLEEEMQIADLKEEALNYKKQLDEATEELKEFKNISLDDMVYEESTSADFPTNNKKQDKTLSTTKQIESKNDTVTFKKAKKTKSEKSQKQAKNKKQTKKSKKSDA